MKIFGVLGVFIAFLCGCQSVGWTEKSLPESAPVPEFFVAVFDQNSEIDIYGNQELASKRFPPCSTFKIISTSMGLDCGIVNSLSSKLGYDGTQYENANWNKDVTLQEAFQVSCVPYYKKLTGRLDKKYVQAILDRLRYGNCDISVWNSNGHNVFWIESSLLISPREQISVLKKIFSGSSPFLPEHVAMLKQCMSLGSAGQWSVFGKTGTGRNHNSNMLEAWFVGFAVNQEGKIIYLAAHGADSKRDVASSGIRETVKKILSNMQ